MKKMNKMHKKYSFLALLYILLLATILSAQAPGSKHENESNSVQNITTASDPFRSNITMPAVQNLTFSASSLSTIEIPSQASPMDPTALAIDVVRGFEPTQRFNSGFSSTMFHGSNVRNSTLKMVSTGFSLFYNALGYPSYSVYNLSFVSPFIVHSTDFVSLGLATGNSFNSSQGIIGVSLILRDMQGNRYYVSAVVSDQHSADSIGLSEWFLGEGFTKELPKYPIYILRYEAPFGPWFRQLSLSESFAVLNLSSAWLDGLLVGGEIAYIGPPLWVKDGVPFYSVKEMDVMFHFILVHSVPFSVNQQPINSTAIAFPYQKSLSFSGILGRSVTVAIEGFLKPSSEKEELLDNKTVTSREVFFDISGAAATGVAVDGEVNITVSSKDVKKCLVTLNNDTIVDLTDALLSSNMKDYVFPKNTSTLKVLLIFYRFNAMIFTFSFLNVIKMTKDGIVEERFSTVENEGLIDINTTRENTNLAIRTDGLTPKAASVDGIEKPLESMLIVDGEMYLIIPLDKSVKGFALYTIQYVLSDRPLYESSAVTPFELHFNGSIFRILTPFNVEAEKGFYLPITVQINTYGTFILQFEYDPSFFNIEQKEIMVYSNRMHYEYFALTPVQTGQSTVDLKILEAVNKRTLFSTLFSVHISGSFLSQALLYFTFCVTVFSIVVVFEGKNLARRILHR